MTTLRIFISSPGDVAEERAKARQVIEQRQRQNGSGLELIPVLWEDLPLQADSSFQEGIDMMLSKEHGIDIAVFILWSRLGSPLGSAVRKPDGSPYLSGTEREFDMMLAARNQSGGERPRILAYMRQDLEGFHQKLKDKDTAHIEELLNQRKLAESFVREHFHDEQGHNIRAYHTFPEPVNFASRLRVHLKALVDEALGQTTSRRVWEKPPYQGLETFDVEHAAIFHGRDAEECELSLLLRQRAGQEGCAFVVVVGASGSGKSSLVRAGLAASLLNENLDDSVRCWRLAVTTPGAAGLDPLENLARAVLDPLALPELGSSSLADLTESLREAPKQALNLAIAPALARAAQKEGGPVRLLLVLDQWEELFTVKPIGEAGRDRFLQVIELLAASGQISVVATLRSDFFPQAQQDEAFLRLKGRTGQFDLLPPRTASLQKIIREPARLAGLRFEADPAAGATLDELILEDAAALADALPLVEYALRELYEQRSAEGLLTFSAYRAMGGVQGAIGNRAEAVFARLAPEIQAVFPDVVQSLVTVEGAAAVRRRAELAVLTGTPACKALVETLIAERFLTADQQGERATVAIAHEALLRSWPRLRALIESNRDMLRLRARVEQTHARWVEEGQDPAFLLAKGKPLSDAESLLASHRTSLPEGIVPYIEISTRRVREQDRRRLRLFQMVTAVFAVLFIAACFASWLAFRARSQALLANRNLEAKNHELGSLLEEAARSDRLVAQEKLQGGTDGEALAYLARANRYVPKSSLAAEAAIAVVLSPPIQYSRATFQGHTDLVSSAIFSPDGRRVLTASYDRTARLWEADSGKLLAAFQGHTDKVFSAIFSPDGRRVLTASRDNTARLWEVDSGKLLATFQGHTGEDYGDEIYGVFSAVFSPDGRRVLTASSDNTARFWEADSGKLLATFQDHTGAVCSAVFSPDGRRALTASSDKTARLWEADTGKLLTTFQGHTGKVYSAVFSPDGRRVLTASEDETARLWEVDSGKLLATFQGYRAVFSPDGRRVLTRSDDRTARLWAADSGKLLATFQGHTSPITTTVFSPDGRRVLTASEDETARLWEADSGKPLATFQGHTGAVYSAVFSPDGRHVLTGSRDTIARVWEADSGKLLATFQGHTGKVYSAVFGPDGRRVLTASEDETARLWEVDTGKLLATFPIRPETESPGHTGAVWAILSSNGRRVLTASKDKTARLWEADSGKLLATFQGSGWSFSAVFSPDGRRVLTASQDETARLWEADSGKLLAAFQGHTGSVRSAIFSPDARLVLIASEETARLWEADSGKLLATFQGHTSLITSAVFSPDGRRVLTASKDKTARLWEAESGKLLTTFFQPHTGSVRSAVFSPDGRRVLTASSDKTARLWEADTGRLLVTFQGDTVELYSAVFSPDGHRVLTASRFDNTTWIWEAESGKLLATFQGHSAVFSPDHRRVLTASSDKTARLWEADTGKLLAAFQGHTGKVYSAVFSPDGRRVLTASEDETARLWPVLPAGVSPPDWYGDFLVWLGGKRIDPDGKIETLSADELLKAKLRSRLNEDSDYARLLRWRLLPPQDRPVDPYGTTTQQQAADLIIRPGMNGEEARHAYNLDPWHPLVHLALAGFEQDPISADFLRRYSLDRLSNDAKLRKRAVEFLREQAREDLARGVEGKGKG